MVRQVAYDTPSRRERKSRHLEVADHLARTFAEGGEEVSEVIAQHLLDALTAVPDDVDVPEIRERAIDALVRAADRGERTAAYVTAGTALVRAAALCEDTQTVAGDLRAADLYERASHSAGIGADRRASTSHAERAVEIFDRHGETRRAAKARTVLGMALRRE